MSKINLLSSQVFNRIAAGEVVERPFSVVKELVENSIDAGATSIDIDIIDGGISSITITDNGSGIEKSELKKALMPHATSKISKVSDLDNITSLGFRGEALASIASVSKINIISKPKEQEFGAKISAVGGVIDEIVDYSTVDGTTIEVKNLFFNTPVREKFLKSERSEESEISSTVARFILCNPQIAFKYTANGKIIYQSFGDGFESALVCVYGVEAVKESFFVDTQKNGIIIKGYLGKHHYTKGNRSYQSVFLNGRYILNQTISSAIANAYSSYMMKRQYPFYVLSITIPPEIVDVNVHPNKLDVRFVNNQVVYGTVYSIVSKVLDGTSEALNIVSDKNTNNQLNTNNIQHDYITHNNIDKHIDTFKNEVSEFKNFPKLKFCDSSPSISNKTESIVNNVDIKESNINDIFAENKAFLESLEKKKVTAQQETIKLDKSLKFIGQALNTFLIFEDGLDLYFIDQHAAHERILFDKLNQAIDSQQLITQPLLLPFILNVNNKEFEFLTTKIDTLCQMGIEISEFGKNAFKISAVPSFLTEMNLDDFFNDILSEIDTLKSLTVKDLFKDKIAQKACKSAIKSGDKLTDKEIEILTEKLKDNLGLKCPHGRPVAIKITRTEIDKWFKRII